MARHWKLVAVSLDFKAAFDTVWRNGLKRKLFEAGLPEFVVRWISSFLDGRTFAVRVGSAQSHTFTSNCGVPQGSPLSPLLFIFYIAEMQGLRCASDDAVKRVAKGSYADDALNWAMGKSYALAARRIQANLQSTATWCGKWRLQLNPLKCESILFGHYNTAPTLRLEIGGRQITQVKLLRYLGVYLTPQLCWEPHIATISAKARPRAGVVRRIAARKVMSHKTSLLFHRSMVESVLTYAAPAWYCQPDTSKQRLQELQENGIRAAFNLPYEADVGPAKAAFKITDIRDAATLQLGTFGTRRLSSGGTTAAYIRYACKLKFDAFGRQMMEHHCPAWRLKPILDDVIPAPPAIRRNWIRV